MDNGLEKYTVTQLVEELISRGIEYEHVQQGQEINYKAPARRVLMVVDPDLVPHKETVEDKLKQLRLEYCEKLMQLINGSDSNSTLYAGILQKTLEGLRW